MVLYKGTKAKNLSKIKQSPGLPLMDFGALTKFCRMKENQFSKYAKRFETPDGPYFYQDNGSNILAVAHTDTVLPALHTTTTKLYHDTLYFCPTLDDRAGVYTILDYLPKHGLKYDILLTTGEEKRRSTAAYFKPPSGKRYLWIFSFDRRGTDVVMYDYFSKLANERLEKAGWKIGTGTYSDIKDLEHLRAVGFNFGVGYHGEHTNVCNLSMAEYMENMRKFVRFYDINKSTYFPHTPMWNMYDAEDGFGYFYQQRSPIYQDTFTDEDIEVIDLLEKQGYDFGARINPSNVKALIDDFQAGLLEVKDVDKNTKNTSPQLSLWDLPEVKEAQATAEADIKADLEQGQINIEKAVAMFKATLAESDAKVTKKPPPLVHLTLNKATNRVKGSEDSPEYKQPRKAEVSHVESGIAVEVHHDTKPALYELRLSLDKSIAEKPTVMMDECTTCHRVYDHNIDAHSTECDDCRELRLKDSKEIVMSDVKEVISNGGGRIVSYLELNKRRKTDERFTYTKVDGGKGYEWRYEYPDRTKVAA